MRGYRERLPKRQQLPADTTIKSRALRRNATEAEKTMFRALREAFPDAKWRFQVPFGHIMPISARIARGW